MQTTRAEILRYIADHQTGNAKDISRALHMTTANVRHHLNILLREGLVEITGLSNQVGRGRPTNIYRLTPKTSPDHILNLLKMVWAEFIGNKPSKQRATRLARMAKRLIGVVEPIEGALPQRLYQTIQVLSELEYEARWEAHADGPQVLFIKCPLASLRNAHIDTCQLDQAILEELVGYPVHQISQRNHLPDSPSYCVFQVLSESEEKKS
jgi:predicted ArsR family transcriptional regulator